MVSGAGKSAERPPDTGYVVLEAERPAWRHRERPTDIGPAAARLRHVWRPALAGS
jgi:hypothetical protein